MATELTWQDLRKRSASPEEILALLQITRPPVDVRQILIDLGVEVEFVLQGDLPGVSGMLQIKRDTGKAIIKLPRKHVLGRQRFTLAHELGHLMYHDIGDEGIHRDDTFTGNRMEVEANEFAAELLVPMSFLERYAEPLKYDVDNLASLFEVSTRTMEIRLEKFATIALGNEFLYG